MRAEPDANDRGSATGVSELARENEELMLDTLRLEDQLLTGSSCSSLPQRTTGLGAIHELGIHINYKKDLHH